MQHLMIGRAEGVVHTSIAKVRSLRRLQTLPRVGVGDLFNRNMIAHSDKVNGVYGLFSTYMTEWLHRTGDALMKAIEILWVC